MAVIPRLRTKAKGVFHSGKMINNRHPPGVIHTVSSTAHLRAFRREGCLKKDVDVLLTTRNPSVDSSTYIQLLQICIANNALPEGKLIHSFITYMGFKFAKHTFLQNQLINMYDKCGSLVDARKIFNHMTERDIFSWNMIIAAYRRQGFPEQALTLFIQMRETAIQPDQFTFASILPVCAKMGALEQGTQIHKGLIEGGFLSDIVVVNALIDMYAKCGSMENARELFDKIPQRNGISWNAIIAGYAQNGVVDKALRLFHEMPQRDAFSWSAMIAGCAQNGAVDEAFRLFKEMPQRDAVSWTAMIAGFEQNGQVEKALEFFKQMQLEGIRLDSVTFASILPACAKLGKLENGLVIHQRIIESGLFSDVIVVTALIDMYAKCKSIQKARKLFDNMFQRNVVSWNAMIAGSAQNGVLDEALRLFNEMPQRNIVSWNAMIVGYVQNGVLDKALRIFKEMPQRDVLSWNAVVAGYAQNGHFEKALEIFKQMQLAGLKPNSATFASILPVCAKMGVLEQGMEIHQRIIKCRFLSDVIVGTALIDMYAKCGSVQRARELFEKMPQRNVVSWNAMIAGYAQTGVLDEALRLFNEIPQQNVVTWTAMIAGYAQNGFAEKALEISKQMQLVGINPDLATFASILPACAKLGALEQGLEIHQRIIKNGFLSDVLVTALIDMYAKCGSIQKTHKLFNKMHHPNVVPWTAMIAGYAMHGFGQEALKLFELMKHSGINPNHVSLVCVLFACSHTGLVDEGCKYFNCMSDSYRIMPTMDHYICIVDLLGRAGYLEEALNFIIKMPIKPDAVAWTCLLGACRSHKNIGLGELVATLLFKLDPKNVAPYVVLSNLYAKAGWWANVQKVWKLMKDHGIKKIPGCSWIEVHKMVHAFCVGDRSHPQTQEIYAKLEKLSWEMKAAGYIPDSRPVLNDVEEEELYLCYHSEKLAIAFGLLNTSPGTTIRVVKNLRVCIECHTATKFISKIAAREIVLRDANRFHHFRHGQCSCRDYW